MANRQDVLGKLPPFKNVSKLVTYRQSTNDIIDEILTTHGEYEKDYDKVYQLFDTGDLYSTCRKLWEFCKYELSYKAEPDERQTVRSPAAILQSNKKVDCKHYSLFIGGILDALKHYDGGNWTWCYRFAAYNGRKEVQHVFVVVKDGSKEIWIDPVLSSFDEHKQPNFYIDEKPMALYALSGIGDTGTEITVDKTKAEYNFYIMVNGDFLALKTLLNSNKQILHGPVKQYFTANGFDFQHLLRLLAV